MWAKATQLLVFFHRTHHLIFFHLPGSDSGCVASCGQGWEKNGDHCYFWSTVKTNWTDAEAFCKKEGAHLASVNSNVTNNFIVERMRELGIGQAWLGGNDLEKESLWKWTDGAPWEFEAWQRGNPNNALGGQHCLIYDRYHFGLWDDGTCNQRKPFVCSKKICAGLQLFYHISCFDCFCHWRQHVRCFLIGPFLFSTKSK